MSSNGRIPATLEREHEEKYRGQLAIDRGRATLRA